MPGMSIAGLLLKVLPMFRQPNLAVIALALPAHAALAWALARQRAAVPVRDSLDVAGA